MYSKKAWGGSVDPFILTKFIKGKKDKPDQATDDPLVSLVVYEWRDESLIGVWPSQEAAEVGNLPELAARKQLTSGRHIEEIDL